MIKFYGRHAGVPLSDFFVAGRDLVVATIEKVLQHSKKVKVNKAGRLAEQEGMVHQHLLEGMESSASIGVELRAFSGKVDTGFPQKMRPAS